MAFNKCQDEQVQIVNHLLISEKKPSRKRGKTAYSTKYQNMEERKKNYVITVQVVYTEQKHSLFC